MRKALQVILLIAIVVMGYLVIDSPFQKIDFDKEHKKRQDAVIERLMDIRTAQITFKEKFGYHTASFDTLIAFVKNDSLPIVLKEGFLTDSLIKAGMTEKKAIELGIIIRDTTYVTVKEEIFGKKYPIDSLRYVPFCDTVQFKMGQNVVTTNSNVKIQVFEASVLNDVYLAGLDKQEIINMNATAYKWEKFPGIKVGDLLEANNYAGNWE